MDAARFDDRSEQRSDHLRETSQPFAKLSVTDDDLHYKGGLGIDRRVIIGREIIFDNVTYEDVCDYVDFILTEAADSGPHFIFAQNPLKVAMASKQQALLDALVSADLLIPDGIGIIVAARLAGTRLRRRVTGVDLMHKLISSANGKGYRIYFLGGRPGVAEQAADKFKAKYPQLRIAGTSDGYFSQEDEGAVIEKINSTSPDILFVCMGTPLQELFLQRNRARLNVPICIGGGGSLDVYSERIRRSPLIFQRLGLEWLYRLVREPRRFRRIVPGLSRYLFLLAANGLTCRGNSR